MLFSAIFIIIHNLSEFKILSPKIIIDKGYVHIGLVELLLFAFLFHVNILVGHLILEVGISLISNEKKNLR